eukprot:scaffold107580_cov66-Phaeocystis_antarctica.AAC.4
MLPRSPVFLRCGVNEALGASTSIGGSLTLRTRTLMLALTEASAVLATWKENWLSSSLRATPSQVWVGHEKKSRSPSNTSRGQSHEYTTPPVLTPQVPTTPLSSQQSGLAWSVQGSSVTATGSMAAVMGPSPL